MTAAKKICYDRILPRDLARPHASIPQGPGRVARAIAPKKNWLAGATIEITFKGGTSQQQDMVRQIAPLWCEFANLKLKFTSKASAAIRVSFDENDGAWSYIGQDNLSIPVGAATMNLGWQDAGVILHEFGHMVGLAHEHQNPLGGIQWNEAAVMADLQGPPNFWDPDTIRHNVLEKYAIDQIIGTAFDPQSIMLYAFPASWTIGGQATSANSELSAVDKAFVGSAPMYPLAPAQPKQLPVYSGTPATIGSPGEQDAYQFVVAQAGDFVVETGGKTDVFLSLYGPDTASKLIAENDDSGLGSNARLEVSLQPGTYFVHVRHYSAGSTGPYRIWVAG